MNPFDLQRDAFGRWALEMPDGTRYCPVTALRAYPVSAPDAGVALMDADGHEIVWIDELAQLDAPLRAKLLQALTEREFLPEILQLTEVSSFATPSTWSVVTDRGVTQFLLKGEEDIRRLGEGTTSEVFLCHDDFHDRQVAVKRVRGMRLMGPVWKQAKARAGKPVPTAQSSANASSSDTVAKTQENQA